MIKITNDIEKFTAITTWCEETLGLANKHQSNIIECISGPNWSLMTVKETWQMGPKTGPEWTGWYPTVWLDTNEPSWETMALLVWS